MLAEALLVMEAYAPLGTQYHVAVLQMQNAVKGTAIFWEDVGRNLHQQQKHQQELHLQMQVAELDNIKWQFITSKKSIGLLASIALVSGLNVNKHPVDYNSYP